MPDLSDAQRWLDAELPRLLEQHDVPAAAVAVYAGGEVIDAAAGILNRTTGVEATTASVFQIGSITKVWTATLVLQLVDEGLVELDAPVRRYVPEFVIADESAAQVITVRQLLSHTSGFEGDIFTDTGHGDDALELYVRSLADVPQLFPPGERFSYSNAGFCVLGRLVEIVRAKPYAQCLRDHLFTPLGLATASNGAEEAILHRAAIGHLAGEDGAPATLSPVWSFAWSNAPAGSQLAMSARDLVAFARMHLAGGTAPDGTAVLSRASAAAMQEPQVDLPPLGLLGARWGLGWELYDGSAGPVIAHDGNTIGQAAYMRLVPDRDVAVVMLTNGGDGVAAHRVVFDHLLGELAGVELPPLPHPPATPIAVAPDRFVGTYSSRVMDMNVTQDADGRLWVERVPKGLMADLGEPVVRTELLGYLDDTLIPSEATDGMYLPHAFVGDDGHGRAAYLHIGRALPRA